MRNFTADNLNKAKFEVYFSTVATWFTFYAAPYLPPTVIVLVSMYPIFIPVLLNLKTNNKKFRESFSIFVRLENWMIKGGSCWDLSDEKAHAVIVFLRLLMILCYLTRSGFGKQLYLVTKLAEP